MRGRGAAPPPIAALLCGGQLAAAAGACSDAAGCSHNGKCVAGACRCAPQWKGEACDVLNLVPTRRGLGYVGRDGGGNITSWGGGTVVDDAGVHHMYAAEIAGHCGMNVWLSNSQVIHASSPDPATVPFKRQSVVQLPFAHEPIPARAPTGEFVVYFTAVLPSGKLPVKGVPAPCTGCRDGVSPAACGTDGDRDASINLPTYMVYSKDPDGPWSTPAMIPGTDVFADSNFAPVINPNGSVVALERGNVIHASDWRDVSTYKRVGSWSDAGEDPYVWRDAAGVYHNIVHVGREHTHGLHYFSTDGRHWTKGNGKAFSYRLDYTDGTHIDLACRERPHVITDKSGDVLALTNGAAPITCHSAGDDDYAFTALQAVGQTPAPPAPPPPPPAPPVPGLDGSYRIVVGDDGLQLHADDGGDHRLSTRYQSHDNYSAFTFQSVGSGVYRIRVVADGLMLHADDEDSYDVGTDFQGDDDYCHFTVAASGHAYTFQTKASGRYWAVDDAGSKLVETVDERGDATLFTLSQL